jgi:putative ABC transport system permease protein
MLMLVRRRVLFVLAMAWREGRAARRRTFFLTVAIAVGVAALVAINSFSDNLRESVRQQARALLGADLALSSGTPLSPRSEALLGEVTAAATVRGEAPSLARVTSFAAMAWAPASSGTRLVQVAAVEAGYPFYGTIDTAPAGEWGRLAETGGALVDSSLLVTLNASVGDTLALGEGRLVIRGTVLNVPGDVGVRTAFGPRVFIPAARVGETKLLTFGSRARYEVFLKLPVGVDAQPLADRFRPALGAERVNLRTVSEDQRRLNDTLSRLGNYLGLVALIALLLGGLGVASAVHVFIKRKMETVAVLRCLGASARTVLSVYLVQAAVVGLIGSLAGAVLGAAVQLVLPRVLGDLLPVDVAYRLSWRALLGGLGLGLWVALAFSLLPLLAVRRVSPLAVLRRPYEEDAATPPREPARLLAVLALVATVVALAVLQAGRALPGLAFAGGIGAALLALWLTALASTRAVRLLFIDPPPYPSPRRGRGTPFQAWLRALRPRVPYLWRQGLANLYRPANQTRMVVLALGFGCFLLSTLLLVQHNLLRDLRVDEGTVRPNVVFFDIQPDQRADVLARLRAEGFPAGPAVPIVPMRIRSVKGKPVEHVLGEAGTAEASRGRWAFRREYRSSHRDTPAPSERIVAGRSWRAGEWRERRDAAVPVSIEEGVARELGVTLGDEIVWDVQGVSLASKVAALRAVDWARFEPNFFMIFPEGPLDEAPQTFVALSRIDDPGRRARFQRAVVEAYPNVSTLDLVQVQQAVEEILGRVALAIRFMALFSLAAGAVVLVGAVAASRYQRVREAVLLRTLGATRGQLLRILLAEYASLGVLAAATAILLSTAAAWALVRFGFDAAFALPVPALLALAGVVVVLTVVVGLLGSAEVLRRPPLEVLRAE